VVEGELERLRGFVDRLYAKLDIHVDSGGATCD
jgi:hypothetical protein